jgi:monomeric sarcosine oxidase
MLTGKPVIVVGGGVMGAASAYWLCKMGRQVTLVDQYDAPNPYGASGDQLRAFRLTYGKDAFYTEMAVKALPLWLALNDESKEVLLQQNGVIEFATQTKGYEEQSLAVLKDMGLSFTKLEKAEIKRQYPMVNTKAVKFALFHKDGGMLWATRAVSTLLHLAQKMGAKIQTHTKIAAIVKEKGVIKALKDDKGRLLKADDFLFATAAWTGGLLKSYQIPLKVTKQQQLYLRPPTNRGRYRPEHFPVFGVMSQGFYGFPLHIHGFLKIGDDKKGPVGMPGPQKEVDDDPKFIKKCRSFLDRFMPELSDCTEMECKTCYYTNTKDDDFILDRLPDVSNGYLATGFSGHGFKFAPLIGKTMAELIVAGKSDLNLQRFRLGRFKKK